MNNASKGIILSGLVFPGLGQVVLRHYKRGIFLMLMVVACLTAIVAKALRQALHIVDKIISEGRVMDITELSNTVTQAISPSDSLMFDFLFLLIIGCWIIGLADAYRIGKKMDVPKQ